MLLKGILLLSVVLGEGNARSLRVSRQIFNPGSMLSGVGLQTSVGSQTGGQNPAGTPVLGTNPAQPMQSQYNGNTAGAGSVVTGTQTQQQQQIGSYQQVNTNPGVPDVIHNTDTGNPGGSPSMTSGTSGYTQYGNPGGQPSVVNSASSSRQDYTGTAMNRNSQSYNFVGTIGRRAIAAAVARKRRSLAKRFNPDVTNQELISNPNPVNVGLSFTPGGLMFIPGSASGSIKQTGVAVAQAGTQQAQAGSTGTGTGTFNPNTLPANQNAAGNFNPANPQTAGSFNPSNPQTAGSFNPNNGQKFIPSNTQSVGSVQTAGNFNPNAFTAGNFDPNAIPAPQYDPSSAGTSAPAFDPSAIGVKYFPPNTETN